MRPHPVRHAVLRDRRRWDGVVLSGLVAGPAGTLALVRADGAAASGTLLAGPIDAGELEDWERVCVEADAADGTVTLGLHLAADATPPASYASAATLDALVLPFGSAGDAGSRRYLWLVVTLSCRADAERAPTLSQVSAQTTGDSYLDHLPAVYRRRDEGNVLERWLALFRAELGDMEARIDDMPRVIDGETTADEHLAWLASWLGFPLPDGLDADATRALLARVPELYRRRGTPAGVADFVELYAGVRPRFVEAYRSRAIWQLGVTSRLGFDTGLVPAPDGMIVPGGTTADPALRGLRGEYYAGRSFERHRLTRIDPAIAFDWGTGPFDRGDEPADDFSVRWTGQLCPRYSETYTFHTGSDDGVRLWVDGRLIIDNWHDHAYTADAASIALTADRWCAIRLEYYERGGAARVELGWSSQSQRREVVPSSRLYAVMDDWASVTDEPDAGLLVGQAIVGESAPQTRAQYGRLLFSEAAHLFSVVVPAGVALTARQRQQLREVLEAEKPAHTDYHVCVTDARMRVGMQATVGVDAIVAGPPPAMSMDGALLGLDSWLGAAAPSPCSEPSLAALTPPPEPTR